MTTNTKEGHTPGPWHVGGKDSTIIYSDDHWAVANATVYHNHHVGQGEANARLIAAAPELLACLKDALDGTGEMTNERIARWRLAVSNAEGW